MNHQTKISVKTVVRYIRDFSIVVAGIAVTLYVNEQVTNRNEKRNLKLYLSTIKLEMENNLGNIEWQINILQKSIGYTNYLNSNDKQSLHPDTIKSYNCDGGYYYYASFEYKQTAFEMFKISGVMRFMDNRNLLHDIWNVYNGLSGLKEGVYEYNHMKLEEIKKEILTSEKKDKDFIPMYNFYTIPVTSMLVQSYDDQREFLEEVIEWLEKELSNK